MAFIEWDERFSVGVKEFDDQHKGLIHLINNLHKAMMQGKGQAVLENTVHELLDYTVSHFQAEEKCFKQFDYPDTLIHKKEHQEFVEKVEGFYEKFQEGSISVTTGMLNFLTQWLIKHIQGTDKKYSKFFNEQGLS